MPVPNLDFVILFVEEPLRSAAFYAQLFNLQPVEKSPTFAMFALPNGASLGLWSHATAEPKVSAKGGGCEIAFSEENIDEIYYQWLALGIPMVQAPTDMDFGRTFVALDPDGHRIRIYRLAEIG